MLASEENAVDTFYKDLKLLDNAFAENPDYAEFLSAPSVSKSHKKSSIDTVFGGRVCGHILSFLCLLCEKRRLSELSDVFTDFSKLREWANKTVVATVTSAVALNTEQEKKLISALEKKTGKKVALKTVIDKSVLGGLTVTLDGEVIDGSVKTNINNIRKVIGNE